MTMTDAEIRQFAAESNRIEGINFVQETEIAAYRNFLHTPSISIDQLEYFVRTVANALLRQFPGMDVVVGSHRPMSGGPHVKALLIEHLTRVNAGASNPYDLHCEYETLHPFADGNGRSGRALWAWRMLRENRDRFIHIGFLHEFYYQTLQAHETRQS